MPFKEAKDEIALSDAIWNNTSVVALREQQEEDFGWWSGAYEFKMPGDAKVKAEEGEWENHTTNSGTIRGNKLIEILASSQIQLFIDVDEDTRKKRKKLSTTEQLANYIIWQADRDAMKVPFGKPLQASAATMAVVRGGVAAFELWYIDEKTGKLKCDARIYDPMFCQWYEDDDGISWFCYRDFITPAYISSHYEKQKKAGFDFGKWVGGLLGTQAKNTTDRIQRYTFINDEEIRVACNGKWLGDGLKHGLDHVPVNIRTCGAIPLLSSIEYEDTMKYSWQSYAASRRRVYPLEANLLSVEASIVTEAAKRTFIAEYDSVKSQNQPPKMEKVGYGAKGRNTGVFLDAAKGQAFKGFAESPNNAVTDAFYSRIRAEMDGGTGLSPELIADLARRGNASLAAQLQAAVEEDVAPFRKCEEETFIWFAEEGVKQFIDGDFSKVTLRGRNRKRETFYTEGISAKDVEESKFDCKLVYNRAQDEALQIDLAIREIKEGLSSPQTAMVKHNLHQDPDKELDNIAQANAQKMAMADPVYYNNQMASWYKEQGNEQMALYHLSLAAMAIETTVKNAAHLLNPQAGNGDQPAPEEVRMSNQPMPENMPEPGMMG